MTGCIATNDMMKLTFHSQAQNKGVKWLNAETFAGLLECASV